MSITKYCPNPQKTITPIDILVIYDKELEQIKKISKEIREEIEKEVDEHINLLPFIRYYVEEKLNNLKRNITTTQKELIIANVILPNDIEIADLLNKNRYTKEHLKSIIRTRQKLKLTILNNIPISNELQKEFDEYKENIIPIIELFKKEYNTADITIILNRISEIVTKYPNYLDSKITTKIKIR